jgi:8-oxo-dGTP pyrophosphatase MutT (NUDIX family)|tara:strand:- start:409 stop:813 length:405 start_codon:yes stop_codon:yes gene_type:complete
MRKTRIVTSFLKHNNKILILKRSQKVKSMKELWAGISGIIENNELPINRAKIEIFEEVGIKQEYITLIKSSNEITVESPQYANHQWIIFPFFFKTDTNDIKLNWENSEFRWIDIQELKEFNTVPSLEKILLSLL